MEQPFQPYPQLLQPVRLANDVKSLGDCIGSNVAAAAGKQYRDIRELCLHEFGELNTIDPVGHHDVREDEDDPVSLAEHGERRARTVYDLDLGLPLLKQLGGQIGKLVLVLDDQNDAGYEIRPTAMP